MRRFSYSLCPLLPLFFSSIPFAAQAAPKTIPSLGKGCFVFETKGQDSFTAYRLEETGFSASLTGTGLSLKAEKLHISDSANKMSPEELSQINALAAYLALSGYYHGISPNCPGLPYAELVTIAGKLPAAKWENIKMERPSNPAQQIDAPQTISIKSLDIHALNDEKEGIRGIFKATGVTGKNVALAPSQAEGDFTFTPNVSPPYKIIVRKMEGIVGDSKISGQGYVLAGEDIAHSKSKAHLSISKIGSLIDQASVALGPRATTALLLARIMSRREADDRISWEIELDNGASKVNNINIPYFVH